MTRDATIETKAGPVRGTRLRGKAAQGVGVWRGIPFATPPVGRLRFAAPEPPAPWTEPLDATRFAPPVPQPRSMLSALSFSSEPSTAFPARDSGSIEVGDVLRLNVYAPPAGAGEPSRPVMVFLHGGAFFGGHGGQYDGSRLAAEGDVVVVTCNYRLGPLGWLHLGPLADDPSRFASNAGLRDQLAALGWVRENIAAFGGDPERVTLFGESAGGASVLCLMAVPAASGLFQRAIAQSPAAGGLCSVDQATSIAEAFLDAVGCRRADDLLELPIADLVRPVKRFLRDQVRATPERMVFGPVWGDDLLPQEPIAAIREGAAAGVPLIVGTTRDEATLFLRSKASVFPVTGDTTRRMLQAIPPLLAQPDAEVPSADDSERLADALLAQYPGFPKLSALGDVMGDAVFVVPALRLAAAQARHAPVWCYRFDYATPALRLAGLGAAHGMELPFVFDQLDSPTGRRMLALGWRPLTRRLGRRVRAHWLSMARSGAPGAGWPRYRPDGHQTLLFNRRDRVVSDPIRERRRAWFTFLGDG